jgi:hypothetical protein
LSDTVDKQRAQEREPDRLWRMENVLGDLARVMRMRREGMSLSAIAIRIGWTERTLHNWLAAAKVMERKGIEMTERSKL